MWADRHACVVSEPPIDGPMDYSDPCMIWYRRITCLLICNPANCTECGYQGIGGIIELMAQSLQRIYYCCGDAIDQAKGFVDQTLREIQDICEHALWGAHEDQHLTLRPDLAQPSPMVAPLVHHRLSDAGPEEEKRLEW